MLKIGTKVWYRGGWGQDAPVATVITGIGRKNGRTVYDTDTGQWGYADQFQPRMTENRFVTFD